MFILAILIRYIQILYNYIYTTICILRIRKVYIWVVHTTLMTMELIHMKQNKLQQINYNQEMERICGEFFSSLDSYGGLNER